MADRKEKQNEEMIEVEAEAACLDTDGVACMSTLPSDILAENILRKNPSRGIKISKGEQGCRARDGTRTRLRRKENKWNL